MRRMLSCTPIAALILVGLIYAFVLLTDASHDEAYKILIGAITVAGSVCGLTLRLSSCSNEDGDKDYYRIIGEGLLACVLNLSSVLVLTFTSDHLASAITTPFLRTAALCFIMIVAFTQLFFALWWMGTLFRGLWESLHCDKEFDLYDPCISSRRKKINEPVQLLPWFFVLSIALIVGLAKSTSFPISVAEFHPQNAPSDSSSTVTQNAE